MRLIARKGKFECALLTVILSGSLADGCEHTLCQRLDENARRLASILDAPFVLCI